MKLFKLPQPNLLLLVLLLSLSLWSCAPSLTGAAPCEERHGITVMPTLIPREDPNLGQARDGLDYVYEDEDCGVAREAHFDAEVGGTWSAGKLQNVTLDPQDAVLHSAAAGQNNMALAWTSGEDVYVGISRGDSRLQIARVDRGRAPHLFFSSRARLHLVYEQDGLILYRHADGDGHPAETPLLVVGQGNSPQVVVDPKNWAHIVYSDEGEVKHKVATGRGGWLETIITSGETFSLAVANDLLLLTIANGNTIELYEHPFTNVPWVAWELKGLWTAENELQGVPQIALYPPYVEGEYGMYDGSEPYWMVAAWVEKAAADAGAIPLANLPPSWTTHPFPLLPVSGSAAAVWHGSEPAAAYDAGLYQTVPVLAAGALSVTALAGSVPNAGATVEMRLGLDVTGGTDPESPAIVWSDTVVNPAPYTMLEATAVAAEAGTATLFLHARTTAPDAKTVWDDVTLSGATVQNGDFEAGVYTYSTLSNIPNEWTPFFKDDFASGAPPATVADRYTINAIYSADRGSTWSTPAIVTENSELSVGTTGAIAPIVYPIISGGTEPPFVTYFYIYEKGDPPPDSTYQRFGRLFMTNCDLGSIFCDDDPPGQPLLSRLEARPTTGLSVVQDRQTPHRLIVSWSARQTDYQNNDIYTSIFTLGAE